ncbi:MAG: nitroreductase/quinone reductase family protein [Chloroflexota bacterium]
MTTRQRQLSGFAKLLEIFASSKFGGWCFVHIFPHIDRPLMKFSGGRFNLGFGQPIGIISHVGAKSGLTRKTPLLITPDGDNWLIVASKAGHEKHPAWYYNLKANSAIKLLLQGREYACIAEEATGDAYKDAWAKVNDFYQGYEIYQARAGKRKIPVFILKQTS